MRKADKYMVKLKVDPGPRCQTYLTVNTVILFEIITSKEKIKILQPGLYSRLIHL